MELFANGNNNNNGGNSNNGNGKKAAKKKAPGMVETARGIVRSRGLSGLFVGLAPRIMKIAPACAIMISSYEYCKRFFRRWNAEHGVYSEEEDFAPQPKKKKPKSEG